MSRTVERTGNDARPLVKVYTKPRLRHLFRDFTDISIVQRQISPELVPRRLRRFLGVVERVAGWNLIIKARKQARRCTGETDDCWRALGGPRMRSRRRCRRGPGLTSSPTPR